MADKSSEKRPRGLAALSPERRREIAQMGGRALHEQGKGHQFTPEEATIAGRKGGLAVSEDRAYMSEIGRKGGLARSRALREDT